MLRVRLVLWYAFLVVLTIATVGAVQYALLYNSLTNELDSSLLDDAKATLRLVETRSAQQLSRTRTRPRTNLGQESLKDLVDDALAQAPDSVSGDALTDRVLTYLMNEMLIELSGKDSTASDPLDAIVQRTLTSRRNNMVEIFTMMLDSSGQPTVLFRTKNLSSQSLRTTFGKPVANQHDTLVKLGSGYFLGDEVRAVFAASKQYGVIVAYSTNDIDDTVSGLLRTYLLILPIALLVASLGGFILSRKALKPIEEIAETAREISAKNLSQRIAIPARQDRELKLLVTTLNSMFSRLEQSFDQIAQFSSDASHELKTPLAILRGEIEQTQRSLTNGKIWETEQANKLLVSMTEEVERMQRIVEGLLLLAKADDRRLPLELERIDLSEFLHSISEDAEILALDRGLTFKTEISNGDIVVNADRTRLYQVMMNLLDNALKYTPKGGEVCIFLETDSTQATFGVGDNGKGIDKEESLKIFQRFYRTESARSHQGEEYVARSLGLGLTIVKSIVEAHNGTITVDSEVGKGSKFIITLPLAAKNE